MKGWRRYIDRPATKAIGFLIALGLHIAVAAPYMIEENNQGQIDSPIASLQINLQETKILMPEPTVEQVAPAPRPEQPEPVEEIKTPQPEKTPEPVEPQKAEQEPRKPELPLPLPKLKPRKKPAKEKKPVKKQKKPTAPAAPTIVPKTAPEKPVAQQQPKAQINKRAAASMGKSQASPAEHANYAAIIQRHIANHLPDGKGYSGRAVIKFSIGPDGRLLNSIISLSSKIEALDQLALTTVRNSAPFPLPPQYATLAQRSFSMPFDFR